MCLGEGKRAHTPPNYYLINMPITNALANPIYIILFLRSARFLHPFLSSLYGRYVIRTALDYACGWISSARSLIIDHLRKATNENEKQTERAFARDKTKRRGRKMRNEMRNQNKTIDWLLSLMPFTTNLFVAC